MTGQLKRAFEEASKFPEKVQDELAEFVLLELASERRWSGGSVDSRKPIREPEAS